MHMHMISFTAISKMRCIFVCILNKMYYVELHLILELIIKFIAFVFSIVREKHAFVFCLCIFSVYWLNKTLCKYVKNENFYLWRLNMLPTFVK